jgi:O-antigen/teichoic acid export membrane protein
VFPVFSRLAIEAWDELAPLYNRIIRLIAAGLAPAVLIFVAFSHFVVEIVYGNGRGDVARLFAFLAPSSFLITLNFTTTFLALAIGWTRSAIVAAGVAAIVNVTANFIAVPLIGVEAAAWATLGAEIAMTFSFWRVLTRRGFPSETAGVVVRSAVILTPTLGLAAAFPAHYRAISLAGFGACLLVLPLVGLVQRKDFTTVRGLLVSGTAAATS